MAMYQDAKGNWRSGEGSGTQYNYTNTAGQNVNNSGNNGPVYTPASNMSAANANERSAMDSFRANPGSALSQLQNLGGTYAERMKSGDTAGAKTVQDYANSISQVAGVSPQSFSFSGSSGVAIKPPAYDPSVNYSNNIPMPQTSSSNIPKGYWENGVFHENKMQTFPGDPNDTSKAWGAGTGPYNSKNDPATDRWGTPLVSPTMPNSSTNGMVKDAQGKIIGSYLPGGGFAPATGQGSQQMSVTTPMAYSPNMGIGSFEQSQFGMPQMGAGSNGFAVKTPDQIKAEAKARTDALLAKQTTIAGQTKQGFQTSFDRLASTTKDDRTLQDAAFQRNTNPFSGGTGFQQDMTGRQREISDQQSKEDLQTRLANVDLSLADYTNATDAQRMQMETDMTNAERAYGMQVDQLALQRQGQALGQFNADRSFNYGATQDQIKNGQWSQTFNQNQSNADRTFNAGRQDVAYNHGQDQITNNRNAANDAAANTGNYTSPQTSATMQRIAANSAAWFNASPAERTRLAAENQSLGASIGAKQDASGNWIAPQPQRTLAGQTMDTNNTKDLAVLTGKMPDGTLTNASQQQQLANEWKLAESLGSITKNLSQMYGIPEGTPTLQAKQLVIQNNAQYAGMYNGQPTMQKIMQDATISNMTADNLRAAAAEARAAGNNQLAKRFDIWDRTGVAPEGIPGVAAGTQLGGKKSTVQTAETYGKVVDNVAQYVTDPDTKVKKLSNPQQVEDTILLSGLSDYEQYKLYMQHGIKWDDPIPKAPGKP